ncbi:unnamed protein product [Chrysoparadoxa australica]
MEDYIWQDREVRFDVASMETRKGEYLIDSINSVEDSKGNNGERGSLLVTNLRLMWVSHKNSKINLSEHESTHAFTYPSLLHSMLPTDRDGLVASQVPCLTSRLPERHA